jgi:hypothetical protein
MHSQPAGVLTPPRPPPRHIPQGAAANVVETEQLVSFDHGRVVASYVMVRGAVGGGGTATSEQRPARALPHVAFTHPSTCAPTRPPTAPPTHPPNPPARPPHPSRSCAAASH